MVPTEFGASDYQFHDKKCLYYRTYATAWLILVSYAMVNGRGPIEGLPGQEPLSVSGGWAATLDAFPLDTVV